MIDHRDKVRHLRRDAQALQTLDRQSDAVTGYGLL